MKLRIKFRKYGPVRFIGHLDLMRFFQKCNRRADIDVAYSTGFSPHQIMSFAAPLSVGLESNGEYMDIEVNSIISSADMVKRLNNASVYGIEIVSAKLLPENAKNAMASMAAARYSVCFRPEFEIPKTLKEDIIKFMDMPSIMIEKQTKKNVIELDLRPGIFEFTYENSKINLLVDASSGGNVKPQKVLEVLANLNGYEIPTDALLITREDTYLNLGDLLQPNFVPLDDIGVLVNE